MRHHLFGTGRHVLRLDPGEEVVASIAQFAQERKVRAAWVSGLGSVDHTVLGFLDPKEHVYLKRTFDERMEIGSLTGNIGMEGERPFCHLHAVVSPRELLAYAGHLHEARVGVVVEVFVIVMDGVLARVVDPATGFARIVLPGEPPPAQAAGD